MSFQMDYDTVSLADAISKPLYNEPSPYLWVYRNERDADVTGRCGSSRSIGARELLADLSTWIEPMCRKLVGVTTRNR